MSRKGRFVKSVTVVFLLACVPVQAAGAEISGFVFELGRARDNAEVAITAFADRACVEVYQKTERSDQEEALLKTCRRWKTRLVNTGPSGAWAIRDLPAGWYSINVSWPQGSVPIWCSKPSPEGWKVSNYQTVDSPTIFLGGESSPFELQATDALQKDFDWCR